MSRPEVTQRKPGRPKAIPERLIPKVLSLHYDEGMGYRAIVRELRKQGISVDWSTIRGIVKVHAELECRRE